MNMKVNSKTDLYRSKPAACLDPRVGVTALSVNLAKRIVVPESISSFATFARGGLVESEDWPTGDILKFDLLLSLVPANVNC